MNECPEGKVPLVSIFIFSGEASGDLHGSHLINSLKKLLPEIVIEGVAGPNMRACGTINDSVVDGIKMENFEVMGFSDVLFALPRLCRYFYKIKNHILKTQPDVVVLIDYPGFNLRLAKALRKQGYRGKIVQYVSPSVWAWGEHRIEGMAKTLDLLLTIYPFEAKSYVGTNLKVEYIGNPLCDYLKDYKYDDQWFLRLGLESTDHLIALFPGSRQGEIVRNIPLLLETAALIKERYPNAVFAISSAHPSVFRLLTQHPLGASFLQVPRQYTYELMRDSHTAIAKGGTSTLELALHERPTAVFYQLTRLNRFYAKYMLKVRLPYYCIVNIIAGREIFPEMIENKVTASLLTESFFKIHADGGSRSNCIDSCKNLHLSLKRGNANDFAAKAILRLL